jgi:uncharacterized protein YecE (DUF72 family)
MAGRNKKPRQGELFDTDPTPPDRPGASGATPEGGSKDAAQKRRAKNTPGAATVEPAAPAHDVVEAASSIPENVRLGTSSWAFPGWEGIVYAAKASDQKLSREGLRAYAAHPLLRTVGLDRTHYAPMSAEQFAAHAAQVPDDFRFLVKAHEACTLIRFPTHPRYGARKGQENDRFLDPEYAIEHCVEPMIAGLGNKAGPLLFQVAPQRLTEIGGAGAFVERLHSFLTRLPKGPRYAVEVRNRELLTSEYAAALADAGAVNCLTSLRRMPKLAEQWNRTRARDGNLLVLRWMVHKSQDYESALDRYEPFSALVDEDVETREEIAALAIEAALQGQEVYVIVNNKAEGSAPLSIFALAKVMAREAAR